MNKFYFLLLFVFISSFRLSSQNIASISGNVVTVDNGVVLSTIQGGKMTSLSLTDGSNLLSNGGYGYFSYNDIDGFHSPSGLEPQITINNNEIADFYFEIVDNFIVEMHYVFKANESGFYTYFVFQDNGLTYKTLSEVRFALRVDKDVFNYAWNVEREGDMISPEELANYTSIIQDATYELSDGSIYTKYDWAVYRSEDTHHGLIGNGYGIWNIEASREYINGGPTMQDLTLHGTDTTPILLSSFQTTHFGRDNVLLKREYASWSKVYGPSFIYINTGTNDEIIANAQFVSTKKEAEWPYAWLENDLYPLDRAEVTGTLSMNGNGSVDNAMVLLCQSGPTWLLENAHWQRQPYSYMFWDEADANGNFDITNVRPGTYDLYAYTQNGKLIDELKLTDVVIAAGSNSIGTVDWNANDKDEVIFQIGEANHKSGEFALGDLPRLYGRWQDCPDDLTYTSGTSNFSEDWYYCQKENTNWNITFDIVNLDKILNPTLKIAIAGVDASPHLDVILNGTTISTKSLGSDSGIRRSSLTGGMYSAYTINVDKSLLIEGTNTITLYCYGSEGEYKGIMYDAVLLEANLDESTDVRDISNENLVNIYTQNKDVIIDSYTNNTGSVVIYSLTGDVLYQGSIDHGLNHVYLNQSGLFIVKVIIKENSKIQKVICY